MICDIAKSKGRILVTPAQRERRAAFELACTPRVFPAWWESSFSTKKHVASNFPGRLSHLERTGSTKVNRRSTDRSRKITRDSGLWNFAKSCTNKQELRLRFQKDGKCVSRDVSRTKEDKTRAKVLLLWRGNVIDAIFILIRNRGFTLTRVVAKELYDIHGRSNWKSAPLREST